MLNKAEQTAQTIMTKYDDDVQKLTKQVRMSILENWMNIFFPQHVARSYPRRI